MSFIEKYGGMYIDKAHGDTNSDKVVYLTFDAGYENENLVRILDILKEEQVPAAFFILGNLIKSSPDVVLRMANEGHNVCNHTYHHRNMTAYSKKNFCDELKLLEDEYKALTGKEISKFYRPPEGRFNSSNLEYAKDMGYETVFWSFAYADWDNKKQPSPNKSEKLILDNIHNGEVLLLHPTSATNAAILGNVIKRLKSDGYRFGSLDELSRSNKNASVRQSGVYYANKNDEMKIALTFDDGPHPKLTPVILDILDKYNIKATFFVVGENVKLYPEAFKEVVRRGHEIGNHSFTHPLRNQSAHSMSKQITECEDEIFKHSDIRTKIFRPPGGIYNSDMIVMANKRGYNTIMWDIDTRDWAKRSPDTIYSNIMSNIMAGDIILMHDFIASDSPTPAALKKVLPALIDQGYKFVTISELIGDGE